MRAHATAPARGAARHRQRRVALQCLVQRSHGCLAGAEPAGTGTERGGCEKARRVCTHARVQGGRVLGGEGRVFACAKGPTAVSAWHAQWCVDTQTVCACKRQRAWHWCTHERTARSAPAAHPTPRSSTHSAQAAADLGLAWPAIALSSAVAAAGPRTCSAVAAPLDSTRPCGHMVPVLVRFNIRMVLTKWAVRVSSGLRLGHWGSIATPEPIARHAHTRARARSHPPHQDPPTRPLHARTSACTLDMSICRALPSSRAAE